MLSRSRVPEWRGPRGRGGQVRGRARGVPAGPWRLCPSRAIGGPGPAAQGRSDRASAAPSSGHPRSRGQKAEAAPTESCPARGLRPARLVTNCAVVPVSKWSRGGAVTSLSSQGDSVLAFGSRVPDLDGKYCIVFRCPNLFRILIDPIPVYSYFIQDFSLLSLHWKRKGTIRLRFEPGLQEISSFHPKLSQKEEPGLRIPASGESRDP